MSLFALVGVVLGACTADEVPGPAPSAVPTPTTTIDEPLERAVHVAIVYPASGEVRMPLEAYRSAVQRARASFTGDVASFREIDLDRAGFRPDVLALLADEGTSLSCAIGTGGRDVLRIATEHPGRRFCVIDDRVDEVPPNALSVWYRYEEAAFLLGYAAAGTLPPDGGTLGFLTPSFDTRSERERLAFTAGAREARPDVRVAVATLTGDGDTTPEERAASAAATLYDDEDAGVLMVTAGVPVEPVLLEAQQRLRLVTGVGPPLSAGAPAGLEPFVLATAHARLELGVSLPLERLVGGWQGGSVGLGFADEALVLTPGGSVRWNEVRDLVAAMRERIVAGEVVPG